MTPLHQALEDYLRVRRQLGFKLGSDQRLLEDFVGFLEQIVRGFARYVATLDPVSEVPSIDLLPAHRPRVAPYIYSPAQITALMEAAGQLTPPLRAASYRTLIGLMASTGLRLGEALALDRADVDLDDGALHVRARQTKQREVPCTRPPPGRCASTHASVIATTPPPNRRRSSSTRKEAG